MRETPSMTEHLAPVLHVGDARAATRWYAQLGFVME